MTFVVGVDGGATKTIALIATENGRIVGRGQSGSSNYHNVGVTRAGEAVRAAVRKASRVARANRRQLALAVVALAAIDSHRDLLEARRFVRRAHLAAESFVAHDSVSALYAGTRGGPGIIVNSGTGSFAAGINKNGEYARAGGWGYLVGDEGSAFDIGRMALAAAFRMLDGRAEASALPDVLRRQFHVSSLDDALRLFFVSPVDEITKLSPIVSRLAKHDRTCRMILDRAGVELAVQACTVARKLNMRREAFPVLTTGGGFRSGQHLLKAFSRRIKSECPHVKISSLRTEPVRGAMMLALREFQRKERDTPGLSTLRNVLHKA